MVYIICNIATLLLLLSAIIIILRMQKTNKLLNTTIEKEKKEHNKESHIIQAILENLPTPTTVKDVNNNFKYFLWSKNAEQLYSINGKSIFKNEYEMFPDEVIKAFQEADREALKKGKHSITQRLILADGKEHTLNIHKTFVSYYQEKWIISSAIDITELEEEKEKEKESNLLKSAFLANMSHEIRTPLNAIMGFSELLSQATETEREAYTNIIKSNTNLLLQLINDILDISKIEAGTLEFIYSDVDINNIMRDLEGIFNLRMEKNDTPVKLIRKSPLSVCFLHTEPNRVSQVLSNLLSNALKYTTEGSITLGYEVRDKETYFFVSDTGVGIPQDKKHTVFNRFSKLDIKKQGTGLGLAISQTIINKLGGQIGVESEEGKGSTFWFTLPVLPMKFLPINKEEAATTSLQSKPEEEKKKEKTILIAEDNDANYLLCKVYLSKSYHLVRAVNGEEAIAKFMEIKPDIILMDIGMPICDGYQATEAIRQVDRNIPILAVTAFAYEEDRQKVMSRGFNGYLPKPLIKKDLFDTLHKMGI